MSTRRIWRVGALLAAGLALAGCATNAGGAGMNSVVGKWQSSESSEPHLTFSDDGQFRGNDGCNKMSGRYEQDGDTVTVTYVAATARGCPGVDDWLRKLETLTVGESTLEVYDASGELLGSLARES
jgi:heat shock protein HslJ